MISTRCKWSAPFGGVSCLGRAGPRRDKFRVSILDGGSRFSTTLLKVWIPATKQRTAKDRAPLTFSFPTREAAKLAGERVWETQAIPEDLTC